MTQYAWNVVQGRVLPYYIWWSVWIRTKKEKSRIVRITSEGHTDENEKRQNRLYELNARIQTKKEKCRIVSIASKGRTDENEKGQNHLYYGGIRYEEKGFIDNNSTDNAYQQSPAGGSYCS